MRAPFFVTSAFEDGAQRSGSKTPNGAGWTSSWSGGLTGSGRSLKHLITLLDELQALGVGFVSLAEGIDATTPAGKLQMHILGAIAEFERGRIVERVKAGLARARAAGTRLGRRRSSAERGLDTCAGLSHAAAAIRLGVSIASIKRWRRVQRQPGAVPTPSGA